MNSKYEPYLKHIQIFVLSFSGDRIAIEFAVPELLGEKPAETWSYSSVEFVFQIQMSSVVNEHFEKVIGSIKEDVTQEHDSRFKIMKYPLIKGIKIFFFFTKTSAILTGYPIEIQ